MSNKRLPRIVAIVLAVLGLTWVLVMGKLIIGVLFFLAASGFFIRANPSLSEGKAWARPRVLVAGFFGVVALLTLIGVAPSIPERISDLQHENARLETITNTLSSMEYDAEGNVPKARRFEFEMAISESKTMPENIASVRSNLVAAVAISGGALLVLACCALVMVLGTRRRASQTNPALVLAARA